MPNRIIKESICTSEKLAVIKDFDFRLWICLITQADDAGRGDARPAILKGRCFPLRESVTLRNISDSLNALAFNGLISLYSVGGRPYYCFPSWAEHQRIREAKPKYPAPWEDDGSPQSAATRGDSRQNAAIIQSNTIQSEYNPNPKESNAHTRFTPPSAEEVRAYCKERGNSVDAECFVDFYASKGWKIGAAPMKDWKAAVRTWEKRNEKHSDGTSVSTFETNDFFNQSLRQTYGDLSDSIGTKGDKS